LKKTLHDHALEKLDVTRLVFSKPCDLSARGGEEILQMLLPAVWEPQSRLICQGRLVGIETNDVRFVCLKCIVTGLKRRETHIFCALSAPLRLFSNCASIVCSSCFTSFACQSEVSYPQSVDMVSSADFINSKFFVCLHFELASFLQPEGLLLDERKPRRRHNLKCRKKNQPFCLSR
jgi:hypothetical protein